MKYARIAILIALVLCLCVPCALAKEYNASGFFSISYDDNAYTLDDSTYAYENTSEDSHWCFILYNDELMFDASVALIPDYTGITLLTASEAERSAFVSTVLEAYIDDNATLLSFIEAGSQKIPFYIFSCQNEDGPYLMAETVSQGRAITFMAYYNDASLPLDERLSQSLTELLSGYMPG